MPGESRRGSGSAGRVHAVAVAVVEIGHREVLAAAEVPLAVRPLDPAGSHTERLLDRIAARLILTVLDLLRDGVEADDQVILADRHVVLVGVDAIIDALLQPVVALCLEHDGRGETGGKEESGAGQREPTEKTRGHGGSPQRSMWINQLAGRRTCRYC